MNKKYFWIKLPTDFFQQREIKKLRKLPNGDAYAIIYLKMLLLTTNTCGYIEYAPSENFIEELAIDIDEGEENIKTCITLLLENNLLVSCSNNKFLLPATQTMTGSETKEAVKKRNYRKKQDTSKTAKRDKTGTMSTIEKEIDKDKDKDKDKEIDLNIDLNQDKKKSKNSRPNKITKNDVKKNIEEVKKRFQAKGMLT